MKKIILLFVFIDCSFFTANAQAPNFEWVKTISGSGQTSGYSVTTDNSGSIYTLGYFDDSVDCDPGIGIHNLYAFANEDIFISKLDNLGNFVWAKSIGGIGYDVPSEITVDDSGNVYTTGYFSDKVDFNPSTFPSDTFFLLTNNQPDAFVLKLNSSGDFMWAKQLGGPEDDRSGYISVDSLGNVYITGYFSDSADFDPSPSVNFYLFANTTCSIRDNFLVKLNSFGDFLWAKQFGSTCTYVSDITLDNFGNIYLSGILNGGGDLDPGPAIYNVFTVGGFDAYVLKLDSNGNFIWAKSIGGPGDDTGDGIKVDNSGNVITVGTFHSYADFDPGTGSFFLSSPLYQSSIFISKLNSSGNFVWAKQFGGFNDCGASSLVLDNLGNVYTIGSFYDSADFDPGIGIYNLIADSLPVPWSTTGFAFFISKLNSFGDFVWAEKTNWSYGNSLTVDDSLNVIAIGNFAGTIDFDPSSLIFNMTAFPNNFDVFVLKLNQNNITNIINLNQSIPLLLSPNPATSELRIINYELPIKSIHIYNVLGVTVYQSEIHHPQSEISFDVSTLAKGLYFVEVISNNERIREKFIKQ